MSRCGSLAQAEFDVWPSQRNHNSLNGQVVCQPDFDAELIQLKLGTGNETFSVDDYLKANLPVEPFLELQENYYAVPSDATCGTAANLYLRIGQKEHWLGIWNFSRGDIPFQVDAGMYDAVIKLANRLTKRDD